MNDITMQIAAIGGAAIALSAFIKAALDRFDRGVERLLDKHDQQIGATNNVGVRIARIEGKLDIALDGAGPAITNGARP